VKKTGDEEKAGQDCTDRGNPCQGLAGIFPDDIFCAVSNPVSRIYFCFVDIRHTIMVLLLHDIFMG